MKIKYRFVSLRFEIVNAFSFRIKKYAFHNGKGNKTWQGYINIFCFIFSILWIDKNDEEYKNINQQKTGDDF